MKTYEIDNRRAWYDPHIKSWTLLTLDSDGNQFGDAEYTADRKIALAWLESGKWVKGDNAQYVGKSVKTELRRTRSAMGETDIPELIVEWKRFFPAHTIGQHNVSYGTAIGERKTGVWATVARRVTGDAAPHWSAEIYSDNVDNEEGYYADIGLWFEGGDLVDYDGVDCLPDEIITVLEEIGKRVSAEYKA